jgi:hypothetical protein
LLNLSQGQDACGMSFPMLVQYRCPLGIVWGWDSM